MYVRRCWALVDWRHSKFGDMIWWWWWLISLTRFSRLVVTRMGMVWGTSRGNDRTPHDRYTWLASTFVVSVDSARPTQRCVLLNHGPLRSMVERSHNTFGDRCFPTSRITPVELVALQITTVRHSLGEFKRLLKMKTHLFGDHGALWYFVNQLLVPRVRHGTFGTRAFSVAGPTVWNSLTDLREPRKTQSPSLSPITHGSSSSFTIFTITTFTFSYSFSLSFWT